MSPGLVALVVALGVALLGGAAWRSVNGRMRRVRSPEMRATPDMDSVNAGNGPFPTAVSGSDSGQGTGSTPYDGGRRHASTSAKPAPGLVLTSEQLRAELGERATLVHFSSVFCAPCRATRRVLADVAGMVDGVATVEIDAESRLDLVRELNVLRTPTVLVLDGDGRLVSRGSGQPRKPDVIAALGEAMDRLAPGMPASHSSQRNSYI